MMKFEYEKYWVEEISNESSFQWLGPQALAPEQMVGVYDDTPLPELPASLHPARDRFLTALKPRAEATGKTCDNNLSYSLARIDVTRPQGGAELERKTVYRLVFRPTDYFHFQFPNNSLDDTIEVNGRETTARAELGLNAEELSLERLQTAKCHFKLGTGTVIITKPDTPGGPEHVVVSIRSYRQLMVGRAQGASYHLSAAEGMLRPADGPDGNPTPFRTAARSLKEELGLIPGRHFEESELRCLGVYLDTKRAQPFVLMFVRVPLTFEEVRARWKQAPHRHENEKVLGLPWTQENAHSLCTGSFEDDDGAYNVASNHAQLGFLLAAAHEAEQRAASGMGRFLFRN